MRVWRFFYWVRILVVLFVIFIGATAALDVSLAPGSDAANVATSNGRSALSDLPEFEDVVHEGGTDKVGGWLSVKIDEGLEHIENLRLEVRDVGSRIGDAAGL